MIHEADVSGKFCARCGVAMKQAPADALERLVFGSTPFKQGTPVGFRGDGYAEKVFGIPDCEKRRKT